MRVTCLIVLLVVVAPLVTRLALSVLQIVTYVACTKWRIERELSVDVVVDQFEGDVGVVVEVYNVEVHHSPRNVPHSPVKMVLSPVTSRSLLA